MLTEPWKIIRYQSFLLKSPFYRVGTILGILLCLVAYLGKSENVDFIENKIFTCEEFRAPLSPEILEEPPLVFEETPILEPKVIDTGLVNIEEIVDREDLEDYIIVCHFPLPMPPPPPIEEELLLPVPPMPEEIEISCFIGIIEKYPVLKDCSLLENKEQTACTNELLLKSFWENFSYRKQGGDRNISGTILLSFDVNTKGKIEAINLLRGIGSKTEEAALKAMYKMAANLKFIPGQQNGRKVKVSYVFPVRMELGPNKEDSPIASASSLRQTNLFSSSFSEFDKYPICQDCKEVPNPIRCTEDKIFSFIGANIKPPTKELDGVVLVNFKINKRGKIKGINVEESLDRAHDKAALQVVRKLKKDLTFTPAILDGKVSAIDFSIPISFTQN